MATTRRRIPLAWLLVINLILLVLVKNSNPVTDLSFYQTKPLTLASEIYKGTPSTFSALVSVEREGMVM